MHGIGSSILTMTTATSFHSLSRMEEPLVESMHNNTNGPCAFFRFILAQSNAEEAFSRICNIIALSPYRRDKTDHRLHTSGDPGF